MKDQILKLAGVKSEAAFYKKFPSEAAFMKVHGKALKKAAMGASMVKDQLTQLTDFSNPPIAQNGAPIAFGDLTANVNAQNAGMSRSQYDKAQQQQLDAQNAQTAAAGKGGGDGGFVDMLGSAMKMAPQIMEMMGRNGFEIPEAQVGIDVPVKAPTAFNKLQVGAKKLSDKATGLFGKADAATKNFGGIAGIAGSLGQVAGGIQAMEEQKNQINTANQSSQVSGLSLKASGTRPEEIKRQYARPEDMLVQPGQVSPSYGVGTNVLARNGYVLQDGGPVGGNPTEIQNTYAPYDLYDDLGYEPLDNPNQVKQYAYGGDIPMAKFGDYFADSGQAQIGSAVGKQLGNLILPGVGGMVGGFLGKVGGNLLGGAKDAQELRGFQEDDAANIEQMALQQGAQQIQASNSSVMEDGGWVSNDWTPQVITKFGEYDVKDLFQPPNDADMLRAGGHLRSYTPPSNRAMQTYAMGGELQVHKGEAESISNNPYLPDGGETIMFRGPSHENGGMPISYGQSPVEVEGGEPAVKLQDGGTGEDNLVVFGNLKIPNQYLAEIGDPKAKGKKFKNYINDLSKIEARQNKIVDKSTNALLDLNPKNAFDKMKLDSLKANIMGANMKLKDIAGKKQSAAAVQSAINDTAEENGLVADDLAKGKIVRDRSKAGMAKYGAAIKKAQTGTVETVSPWGGNYVNEKHADDNNDVIRKIKHADGSVTNFTKDGDRVTHFPNGRIGYLESSGKRYMGSELPSGDVKWDDGNLDEARFQLPIDQLGYTPAATEPQQTNQPAITPPVTTRPGGGTNQAKPKVAVNRDAKIKPFDIPIVTTLPKGFQVSPTIPYKPQTPDFSKLPLGKTAVNTGLGDEYKKKMDLEDTLFKIYNEALPYLRGTDQEPLDSNQLMGEMYALSQNQLEPVQAQRYQPQLQSISDISYQDQLNANQADFNAIQRQVGYNPAALAALAAQKYGANEKVLAEQFRANQGRKDQMYNQNIATLNDAQLKNLGIFDTQYGRQAQAKSATKATAQAALNSISAKIAQNKLENRTLGVNENMYNYRYDNKGRAINKNPLLDIDAMIANASSATPEELKAYAILKEEQTKKTKTKEKSRNGSIVKAIKNL
jgi:hypothetical protein